MIFLFVDGIAYIGKRLVMIGLAGFFPLFFLLSVFFLSILFSFLLMKLGGVCVCGGGPC